MRVKSILVATLVLLFAGLVVAQELPPDTRALGPLTAWTPPLPCEYLFTDVPCTMSSAVWIEQLFRDGITTGTGPSVFEPTKTVTRQQMAVFLERTMRGASGWPPNIVAVYQVKNTDGSPNTTASGTELRARVASIPTSGADVPTEDNPWVVLVGPGTYDLGSQTLTLSPYVTLQGSGIRRTTITSTGGGSVSTPIVAAAGNVAVTDLFIRGTSTQTVLVGLSVSGNAFQAERIALLLQGTQSVVGVDATGASSMRLRDMDIYAYGSFSYGVRMSGSHWVEIDRSKVVFTTTGTGVGRGIELSDSGASIRSTRVEHSASDASRGAGLYMYNASTCEVRQSQFWGDTLTAAAGYGAYLAGESELTADGSEFNSSDWGTSGTSYGIYCTSSKVTVSGGKVWGDDYGVYLTGASSAHSCSLRHLSLQGMSAYSISNGPNYSTLLASAELRGGGTTSTGTLRCVAVYDTVGGFWSTTCP